MSDRLEVVHISLVVLLKPVALEELVERRVYLTALAFLVIIISLRYDF